MDSFEQHGVKIRHHFGGGTYAKETLIPRGKQLLQHVHPYEHLSILAAGEVLVVTPTRSVSYSAPACITMPAGIEHTVVAVTDVLWFCIHATNETDLSKVDKRILTP